MSNNVQAMTIAMFGAAAGAYTAELEASVEANGVAAVANSIMNLQQPLLGLDLSDDADWTDFVLANLGINDTNAAYGTAAAYFADRLADGATRGDVIAEAVAYLLGGNESAEFADIAAAFVAQVEAAESWSLDAGATVLDITTLRAGADGDSDTAAADPAVFNLTAALATLEAAQTAADEALEASATVALENWEALGYEDPDLDGEDGVDAEEAAAFIDAYEDPSADLEEALDDVDAADAALAAGRAGLINGEDFNDGDIAADYDGKVATDARLDAILAAAQANFDAAAEDAESDLSLAAAALEESEADLATDIAENGTNDELVADARDAFLADAEGEYGLGDGADWAIYAAQALATEDDAETAEIDEHAVAVEEFLSDVADLEVGDAEGEGVYLVADLIEARDAFIVAAAVDAATYEAVDEVEDLATAQDLVDERADLIEALADAEAVLAAVEPAAEAYDAAMTALEDAQDAIAEAGYDLNAEGYGDLDAGADADEMEVYTVDGLGGAVTLGAGDVIVLTGYTYNSGDLETDGNNSVKEFFLVEDADAETVTIVFEDSVFGSNTVDQAETTEVVLTGVTSIDELMIGSTYLQLA